MIILTRTIKYQRCSNAAIYLQFLFCQFTLSYLYLDIAMVFQ